MTKLTFRLKGGPGSGNHGHAGRPGQQGGSANEAGPMDPNKFNPFDKRSRKLPMPDTQAKFAGQTDQQLWDAWHSKPVGSMDEHVLKLEIDRRYDEAHQRVPGTPGPNATEAEKAAHRKRVIAEVKRKRAGKHWTER